MKKRNFERIKKDRKDLDWSIEGKKLTNEKTALELLLLIRESSIIQNSGEQK